MNNVNVIFSRAVAELDGKKLPKFWARVPYTTLRYDVCDDLDRATPGLLNLLGFAISIGAGDPLLSDGDFLFQYEKDCAKGDIRYPKLDNYITSLLEYNFVPVMRLGFAMRVDYRGNDHKIPQADARGLLGNAQSTAPAMVDMYDSVKTITYNPVNEEIVTSAQEKEYFEYRYGAYFAREKHITACRMYLEVAQTSIDNFFGEQMNLHDFWAPVKSQNRYDSIRGLTLRPIILIHSSRQHRK
jgi:hypothetical protein